MSTGVSKITSVRGVPVLLRITHMLQGVAGDLLIVDSIGLVHCSTCYVPPSRSMCQRGLHDPPPRSVLRRQPICISSTQASTQAVHSIPTSMNGLLESRTTSSYCFPLLNVRHRLLQTIATPTTRTVPDTEKRTTLPTKRTRLIVEIETTVTLPHQHTSSGNQFIA